MEKGLNEYILKQLQTEAVDCNTFSPLTLAYIGDGIYELIIRTMIVNKGNKSVNQFHKESSSLVKAKTQSDMMEVLIDELTQAEMTIYKRGRNAKSQTIAKNATMKDYRRATGFEAVMGYLYLNNEMDRLLDLIKIALSNLYHN